MPHCILMCGEGLIGATDKCTPAVSSVISLTAVASAQKSVASLLPPANQSLYQLCVCIHSGDEELVQHATRRHMFFLAVSAGMFSMLAEGRDSHPAGNFPPPRNVEHEPHNNTPGK